MAITGQVVESPFRNRTKCEVLVEIAIDGTGAGTAVDVNLTETFTNSPQMMVVIPVGCDGTWTATYNSATPKITVDCSSVGTAFQSKNVEVILVAYDTV